MVTFAQLPSDVKTRGFYNEIDNTGAVTSPTANPKRALLVGYLLSSGTASEGDLFRVDGELSADATCGIGSQLAEMCRTFKRANPLTELWAAPIDAPSGGTAAAGEFDFAGTATAAGTVSISIGERTFTHPVAVGDTGANVGAAIETLINADTRCPVTASDSTGTVTITCRWKGLSGNDIILEKNRGEDDALPAGITNAVTVMASGAGVGDASAAITAMAGLQFGHIGWGFLAADDTNLDLVDAEMATRWGPLAGEQKGHGFVAMRGTVSEVTTETAYAARNSPYLTVMDANRSYHPAYLWAANVCAVDAAEPDATRPRQTLALTEVSAGAVSTYRTQSDRNTLLSNGCATHQVLAGTPVIGRLFTTYQRNDAGSPDTSYQSRETLAGLQYMSETWHNRASSKFARTKLVANGTAVAPGVAAVTPNDIAAEAIAWYQDMISLGHAEDLSGFKDALVVTINATDANRCDISMRPNVANHLAILGTLMSFRL